MVNIILNSKKSGHRDVNLEIALLEINTQLDSYYLGLDSYILPEEDTYEKTWKVLKQLIINWKEVLKKKEKTYFLPIDFSDEYIGCIKIEKRQENYYMSYGWTTAYQKIGVVISQVRSLVLKEQEFRARTPEVLISIDELIENIIIKMI